MRIVRRGSSLKALDFLKWRREATDAERAPFQAKRAREFIELYRFLARHRRWVHISVIARAVGMDHDRSHHYRQVRRCLRVLEVAGYIETRIVKPATFRRESGVHGTMARIKVERPKSSRSIGKSKNASTKGNV
jgi:hypothetical protein